MIQNKIRIDIDQEFTKLRKNIEMIYQQDYNIEAQKYFLTNYISSEVTTKAELLLDTLLNYLMEKAIKRLDKVDIIIQNDFFNQDFRGKIREWVRETENQLELIPPEVAFSPDPRWKQSVISGGAALIGGSTVIYFIYDPTKVAWAIISGLLTVIVSAYMLKRGFEKAEPKAKSLIKADVEKFVNNAEKQVSDWLISVTNVFSDEFTNYCNSHGLNKKRLI